MDFSKFEKIIGDFYQKSFSNAYHQNIEFEIRFGKIIYDKQDKKTFFDSSVDIEFFYKLKNTLNSKGFKHEIINTIETTNENGIKKIVNLDSGKTSFMKKNKLPNYDVYEYDLRFALSEEKTVKEQDWDLVSEDKLFKRQKTRYRYSVDLGFIDLTKVKTNEKDISYEIEIEILQNKENSLKVTERVKNILLFIFQIKQDNIYITSSTKKRRVFSEYKELVGSSYFIGAQPETLQKEALQTLYQDLYSVTDKADGERAFMYINNNGEIFYIDSNINNIYSTDLSNKTFKNCILDGELVKMRDTNITVFYAFDMIFYNGIDVRGNSKYLLTERLEITKDIINSIIQTHYYKAYIKKFIYRNVFLGSKIILKNISNMPYKNDGLIFTPMNEPYPLTKTWPRLFKWKSAEMNTIDFFSVRKEDGEWELYVQTYSKEKINTTKENAIEKGNLVLFDINKLCGKEIGGESANITFKTRFDENKFIDPTTNEKYVSNTVIEFYWDVSKSTFIPVRTRWDKTANPKKHGNFKTVACSIWKNIINPITEENLYSMNNNITKLINNSSSNYYFSDVISNIDASLQNVIGRYNCEKSFINYYSLNENSKKKDLVKCSKFEYFLESKESLESFLELCSKKTNYLLISYIDSEAYENIRKSDLINITSNEILYVVLMEDKIYQIDNIRSKISMYVKNYKNECDMTTYIINQKEFEIFMKKKGFDILESNMIKGVNDNQLSGIYRYSLFKVSQEVVDSKTVVKQNIEYDKNLNLFVDKGEKSLFKIDNLYFLLEILNSTDKYRFKKTKYPNYFIKTFSDLENVIQNEKLFINKKIKLFKDPCELRLIDNEDSDLYFYEESKETQAEEEYCNTSLYIII